MIEMVHNVKLDLTYYSGQDLYSDGAVEDEMLKLVQEHEESELNVLVRDSFSWPFLYHFSKIRQNIVTWLPITKEHNVLEIGAGCGAITGGLASMAKHVTCIELSKKRSLINANRNKNFDNIEIKVGNFTDVEPNLTKKYDFITLIGVFEYAECYIQGENPYLDFLNRIKKHLKPNGKIVIAIENRLGMKYLAGCKEDHTARIGEGLDYYPTTSGVKTYDKKELSDIFDQAGFSDYHFFYPYPDYKLPLEIFSDKWLPRKGSLTQNINNLDQSRIYLFDECNAFDKAIELGVFDEIANSYEIILSNSEAEVVDKEDLDYKVVYSKFSNDRGNRYAIQTQILSNEKEELLVRKIPLSKEASLHVHQIYENEKILSNVFKGSRFEPNAVREIADQKYFSFIQGISLEHQLDVFLFSGNKKAFYDLLDSFIKEVKKVTHDYYNIDFIPGNILIDGDKWHVIDYEWIFAVSSLPVKEIDIKYLIYRALYYYCEVSEKRKQYIKVSDLYAHFDINESEILRFHAIEEAFQKYIDDGYYKLATAKNEHHRGIIDVNSIMDDYIPKCWKVAIKIFYKGGDQIEDYLIDADEYEARRIKIVLPMERPIDKVELTRLDGTHIYGLYKAYTRDGDAKVEFHKCYLGDVLIGHEQVFLHQNQSLSIDLSGNTVFGNEKKLRILLDETRTDDNVIHVIELKNNEIAQQKEYMEGLKENIRRLEEALQTMENSSSWKVTKLLRSVSRMMHGEKHD